MKEKSIKFSIPIIGTEYLIWVYISSPQKGARDTNRYFKKLNQEKYSEKEFSNSRGKSFLHDDFNPLMWINIKQKNFLPTVAHESCHCVIWIFNYCEIDISKSEEVFAMVIGNILREVMRRT